jgi:Flp pilus assembly pilin Flp
VALVMRTATNEYSEHESIATAAPFPRGRAALHAVLYDEHGQSFAEYGLILTLIVLVAAAGLSPFGAGLATMMGNTFSAVVAAF